MYQDLSKFKLPNNFRGKSKLVVQLWWFVHFLLFKNSPQIFYAWRVFVLRLFGAKIGKNVIIRPSVEITYPWKLVIGDNTWIGDCVTLYTLGEIKIGKNVVISQKSYLCGGSHNLEIESFDIFAKTINVEDECWIASDVFLFPGVTIGYGTVVGARSTVMSDLPSKKICFGTPAKVIRERV